MGFEPVAVENNHSEQRFLVVDETYSQKHLCKDCEHDYWFDLLGVVGKVETVRISGILVRIDPCSQHKIVEYQLLIQECGEEIKDGSPDRPRVTSGKIVGGEIVKKFKEA
ncbi:hypothetical protein GOBAR_DD11600 [Gossypium barbadense]|nr:hypothetical protein GOBAR_DD11600 [Gossypium barbadense]